MTEVRTEGNWTDRRDGRNSYLDIQICRTTLVFRTLQDLKAMKSPLGMESEGIVCLRLKSFTKTFFSGKRFYKFLICLLKESSP